MHPELFQIPFLNLTVWTYGVMMVVGFLAAVSLIRYLSRNITPDPQYITNAALYSLMAGVAGARIFYVLLNIDKFRDNFLSVFAIWQGGLVLLGGVISAITVIIIYLRYHKLPARRYLDILAIALMLALAFGRIGCFMKGCCFGKPTDLSWAVRFPYRSDVYYNQVYPNPARDRAEPYFQLSDDFFGNYEDKGKTYYGLKQYEQLTPLQKNLVDNGLFRCLPVHPTQLYSSANALIGCLILYLFWRRNQNADKSQNRRKLFTAPGCTFALMFILYGIARFSIEFLRDDNPF